MAYTGHNHDQSYVRKGFFTKDSFDAILSGTTSATPDAITTFAHGLGTVPLGAIILKGNVYVSAFDATNISVGSRLASQAFSIGVSKD